MVRTTLIVYLILNASLLPIALLTIIFQRYSTDIIPAEGTMFQSPTFKILDFLFGIPIIHDVMFGVYRKQIVEKSGNHFLFSPVGQLWGTQLVQDVYLLIATMCLRALISTWRLLWRTTLFSIELSEKMGLAWTAFMDEQWEALPQLREMAENIKDPNLKIPEYYYAPIHAYKDGKLRTWYESLAREQSFSIRYTTYEGSCQHFSTFCRLLSCDVAVRNVLLFYR